MISHATIERVREVSILDVVNRYSDITLKKAGEAWKGHSPFTNEKTPSFYVHPKKNLFKCFSTGHGGNSPINFVMLKEGIEFVDAVKKIAEWENIPIEYDKNPPKEDNVKADIRAALEWACAHFCANDIPKDFIKYRDFPEECLQPFRVGYAKPAWDDLLAIAQKAGHRTEILLAAGLIRKSESGKLYDAFRDRIMFPIFDYRGNVVAFTGRDAETQAVKEGAEKPPKYINSPDTCYNKSHHLFGLYQAIKGGQMTKDGGVYLVEGPTDVIRFHKHGLTNTVAPCGSALTEDQAKLLKRFTDKIIYVPDNDCDKEPNAGIEAMERNAPIAIKAGFTVKVLIPGIGATV